MPMGKLWESISIGSCAHIIDYRWIWDRDVVCLRPWTGELVVALWQHHHVISH